MRIRTPGARAPWFARSCFLLSMFAAPAWVHALQPDLATLVDVPRHVLPPGAVARALETAPRKGRPYQYAVAVSTSLTLADGVWQPLDAGTRAWRQRVHSPGAQSLSLYLSGLDLPEGAAFWVYDSAGHVVHGPYSGLPAGGLWTPIVRGDEIVVELRVPSTRSAPRRFDITRAYHGYRSFDGFDDATPAKSGACNVDVACSQAAPWSDEVRSVARLQINGSSGSFLCSGQLVNNARQDLAPYFLTADHCGVGDPGRGPAEGVILYFNYQKSQCNGALGGDLSQTMNGGTLVADSVQSDFTLIRLAQLPPEEYNVYYAGWNVRGEGSTSGAGIHHPGGDEKAISLYDEPISQARTTIEPDRTIETWRVVWAEGTTEPGSSGSGLWNQQHELVGVLSGGEASCQNPRGEDFYGRLDVAWAGDPDPCKQLKAHLDPDDTGITSIGGRDPKTHPASPGPASNLCGGQGQATPSGGGPLPLHTLLLLMAAALTGAANARRPAQRR